MLLRITPTRQLELGQLQMQQRTAQAARLEHQITSGVRIHRPSDDPRGQKTVLLQQSAEMRYETQERAVTEARTVLNIAHVQLLDAHQLLSRAQTLALEGRNAAEPEEQKSLALELDALLRQLESIANAQHEGQYLFSGTTTQVAPFPGAATGSVTYAGSDRDGVIPLAGEAGIDVFMNGQEIFQPGANGRIVVQGHTGAAPGPGTSSGSARSTLTVRHTATLFEPGSGVQPGTSSPGGDTIIGPAGTHQLTVTDSSGTGGSGTVSLNGGKEVSFTSSDGDLLVTGPNGEAIHLDMTAITFGFTGTIDLTAQGTISIDGGVTESPITFSENQTLINDPLGLVQHFDTREITRTGTDRVEPELRRDPFEILKALRDDLLNNQGLSRGEQDAALGRRIADLEAAGTHLLDVIGRQSVTLRHLDSLEERIGDLKLESQRVLAETQGTDFAGAVLQLQQEQTLLQFTLASLSRLNDVSILNFIR